MRLASGRAVAEDRNLAQLAEEAGQQFSPITQQQFSAAEQELRAAAQQLEQALSADPELKANWQRYLQWSLLEPHLQRDVEITPRTLARLDQVLKRFRANQPGLELPVFRRTADALDRYQSLAIWAEPATNGPNARAMYRQLLQVTSRELRRHAEHPTPETGLTVARAIAVIEALDQDPALVDAVRDAYGQPNLIAIGSANAIRALGQRPVDQRRPVRDLILGTRIYGQSQTVGAVSFALAPGNDHIALVVSLAGHAYSNTKGYNGPVVIRSRSTTAISARAAVRISDSAFDADIASASAHTDARIQSICKTGGNFGRRLVEKVAWDRACQQKGQSERIASEHAAERVRNNFGSELRETLAGARRDYQQYVRDPLVRRGAVPRHLRMTSTASTARVETTFATRSQLGAGQPPPKSAAGVDLSMRIHQSAVGNYLALAIGGATIHQASVDEPPKLTGDIPPWLEKLASRKPPQPTAPALQPANRGDEAPPFKPWSLTLNSAAPASVQFDDGRLTIRIRAALLSSDENEFTNWDFIVRYALSRQGNQIVLQRDGPIEVFPTGFDPQWDQRISAQQSGIRNTLAKNVNARADSGQGFPSTIEIDAVTPPRLGELKLVQLQADGGWLTLGWQLP